MNKRKDYLSMEPLEVYKVVASGQLKKFPHNYLDKERIKEIFRHIVLNQYHFKREDICTKITPEFMRANYLGGVHKFFNSRLYLVVAYSFPEMDIREWEFSRVSKYFWRKKENQKDFVCWIAKKEGLDLSMKSDVRKITIDVINKYGGSNAAKHAGGVFKLIDSALNGKFKEWEVCKKTSWSVDEIISATKWLIEEKLCYTPEQVCTIKVSDFIEHNVDGMLQKGCNHSILYALELAYPGVYQRNKTRGLSLKESVLN